ncbi:MAG: ATPase [Bacteroidetes bacterium]|nr:MAG: ATPase [Bacteroidota bacterium]
MSEKDRLILYGTRANASEVKAFCRHIFKTNMELERREQPKSPVCIWGKHGVGKTELVEQLAREAGWPLVVISPAQFEEMGDLLGMPAIEKDRTVFRAPAWVPDAPGPGILLLDDFNRADDRILRGCMQLLQNFRLISWALPPQWQIVLTANPDGGDYSVTPLDDAMLTRMLHIALEFEVKTWAKWAEKAGVDPRGINFVLTYPEVVSGDRTTPRTLVRFFDAIALIPDWKAELPLVKLFADSCLDEAAAAAFLAFVHQNLTELPDPASLLGATDFEEEVARPLQKMTAGPPLRVDILHTVCTRLVHWLDHAKPALTPRELDNLRRLLLLPFLPADLRLAFARDLVNLPDKKCQSLLADPEIGALILG